MCRFPQLFVGPSKVCFVSSEISRFCERHIRRITIHLVPCSCLLHDFHQNRCLPVLHPVASSKFAQNVRQKERTIWHTSLPAHYRFLLFFAVQTIEPRAVQPWEPSSMQGPTRRAIVIGIAHIASTVPANALGNASVDATQHPHHHAPRDGLL